MAAAAARINSTAQRVAVMQRRDASAQARRCCHKPMRVNKCPRTTSQAMQGAGTACSC